MLAAENRLRKKTDIDRVWKTGRTFLTPIFSLKSAKNGLTMTRFAVVVGLKVDKKAVGRNLAKRRIREALRPLMPRIAPGFDVIVFGRGKLSGTDFAEIDRTLRFALEKTGLLKRA